LLRAVLDRRRPPRTAILGGDTSVAAGTALAIRSLTLLTPIDPGAPLCLAHGGPVADGLEVIFKGGQLGREDFLGRAQGQQQH
ncbi:MAG TPA: nucleotide-binding domain containing protein, partial [Bryobacteraceae bacterium]|nr:nucleotide-binding domain containing protein [Bryobacteraceae bacterium]